MELLQESKPEASFNTVTEISVQQQRDAWEAAWNRFKNNSEPIEQVEDVPWPLMSCDDDDENLRLLLDRWMDERKQRDFLRKIVLSFHPDKFFPRFQDQIVDDSTLRASIQEMLNAIYRLAWSAMKDLSNAGND
jgi:hypothetical protein